MKITTEGAIFLVGFIILLMAFHSVNLSLMLVLRFMAYALFLNLILDYRLKYNLDPVEIADSEYWWINWFEIEWAVVTILKTFSKEAEESTKAYADKRGAVLSTYGHHFCRIMRPIEEMTSGCPTPNIRRCLQLHLVGLVGCIVPVTASHDTHQTRRGPEKRKNLAVEWQSISLVEWAMSTPTVNV